MLEAVSSGLTTVIGWTGEVVTAVTTGELSALLPLFGIGIAISAAAFAIKLVRSITWGA